MKFSAASLFLLSSSAAAFSAPTFGAPRSSALKMTATETQVYTFAKSEEIFAEAQEVSF